MDDQAIAFNPAVEGGRVAAAFDLVDPDGIELASAVPADHLVALLYIAFTGRPADITGVEGGPDNTVRALQDKIIDGLLTGGIAEMLCLPVVEQGNVIFHLV